MGTSSWHDRLQARWAARLSDPSGAPAGELELRQVPTFAERVVRAARPDVWAALEGMQSEAGHESSHRIVGAPTSGLGAASVCVGPPLPPFGLRTVLYSEVTAVEPGWWSTSQTSGGTFEHTETLLLEEAGDGSTLARVTGRFLKPAPRHADLAALQKQLDRLAADLLERLAARAEGSPPAPTG